mgnify:CR=1 FL=1
MRTLEAEVEKETRRNRKLYTTKGTNYLVYYKEKEIMEPRNKNEELLTKGAPSPIIEQGEGRVNVWENPVTHGIHCPNIIAYSVP